MTRHATSPEAPISPWTPRATTTRARTTLATSPATTTRRPTTLAVHLPALMILALLLAGCNLQGGSSTVFVPPTPQPSVPPIAHDCVTGDDALNPDPTRYLAVAVRDANGDPLAARAIHFAWFSGQGTNIGTSVYYTDASGVATPLDHDAMSYLPTGSYNGMIAVDGTVGAPGLFTACGNVPLPGTVTLREGEPTRSNVTLDVHDGGAPLSDLATSFGYVWGHVARLSTRLDPGPTHAVEAIDGEYLVGITAREADTTYVLYQPVTVHGDTSVPVDVATAPSTHLRYAVRDGGGSSNGSASLGLFRKGADVEQGLAASVTTPDARVTPGTYDVNAGLALQESFTSAWSYGFSKRAVPLEPAGTTRALAIGGPLAAHLTTDRARYAPGDTVELRPVVLDAAGFQLYRVSHRDSATGTSELAELTVRVTDPSGSLVLEAVTPYTWAQYVSLQSTAVAGTYTATLTWPIGPYRNGPVTATSTFEVR